MGVRSGDGQGRVVGRAGDGPGGQRGMDLWSKECYRESSWRDESVTLNQGTYLPSGRGDVSFTLYRGDREQYSTAAGSPGTRPPVISLDFPLELPGFFQGKHLIHFLVLKMKDFRNFVLDNCILGFDAEQVYLKPQVINLKNKF